MIYVVLVFLGAAYVLTPMGMILLTSERRMNYILQNQQPDHIDHELIDLASTYWKALVHRYERRFRPRLAWMGEHLPYPIYWLLWPLWLDQLHNIGDRAYRRVARLFAKDLHQAASKKQGP